MFSMTSTDLNATQSANFPFSLNSFHPIGDRNAFINFKGRGGNPISFTITQSSPVSNTMNGRLIYNGGSLYLNTLAFYGYTKYCPSYTLQWNCQSCPLGCKLCDTYPSFYCA